jgi:hypothetical protein
MSIYNFGFPASPIQMQAMQPAQSVPFAPINYGQVPMVGQPLNLQQTTPSTTLMDRLRAGGKDAATMMAQGTQQQLMQQAQMQQQPMLGLLQSPQPQQVQMPQPQQQAISPYMQNLMQLASGRYG